MGKHRKTMPRESTRPECRAVEPFLEACVDDELEAGERAGLEAHLAACPGCTAELRMARRIRSELRELPAHSCPESVVRSALTRAAEHPPLGRRLTAWLTPFRLWQPAFAALLLAALGLGIWYVAGREPAGPTAAEVAQAETEVKLAFAYLGRISRRTGTAVGDEVLEKRVVEPMTRAIAGAVLMRSADANGGNGHER